MKTESLRALEIAVRTARAFIVEPDEDDWKEQAIDLLDAALALVPDVEHEEKLRGAAEVVERLKDFAQIFDAAGETRQANVLRDAAGLAEEL